MSQNIKYHLAHCEDNIINITESSASNSSFEISNDEEKDHTEEDKKVSPQHFDSTLSFMPAATNLL